MAGGGDYEKISNDNKKEILKLNQSLKLLYQVEDMIN